MEMNVVQVNSALFSHYPTTKRLEVEISDIGVRKFQRLYNDAADVGFALRNPKTGNVTRWAVTSVVRGPDEISNYEAVEGCIDDDVLGWYLVPTSESLRRNPQMKGYCIMLIND